MTASAVRSEAAPRARPPGRGLLVGLLLLLLVEAWLHSDAFLHRYRSVFAAGRALDKTLYAERHCPRLLLMGNSRTDNGFDARRLQREIGAADGAVFNLGLPGADTRVLAGVVDRLDSAGCLAADGVRQVVLVLDEALVQPIDTLGQTVFFAPARRLWADGQYHDALRASLRLYGYTDNLRQLREPASLQRFVAASLGDVEPVGGGAAEHLGYRAGSGALQDLQAAQQQEAGSRAAPDEVNLRQLWRLLDLLAARGVDTRVAYPPLLGREVLYLTPDDPAAAPYQAIAAELQRRGVPVLRLDDGAPRRPSEFVNPGHLNDAGAQRYTRRLAQALKASPGAPAAMAAEAS